MIDPSLKYGVAFTGLLLLVSACSGDEEGGDGDSGAKSGGSGGSSSGSGGVSGSGGTQRGGTSGTSGTSGAAGRGPSPLPTVTGEPDPNPPPGTDLPPLPGMVNVKAKIVGDSVNVSFDPIDGAVDYRVYALPANEDINVTDANNITVQNGTFRCAGNRQNPPTNVDEPNTIPGDAITSLVDDVDVYGYRRQLDEATLGYVYATPGEGRIPVYALGESGPSAENDCYFARWGSTRVKQYVTSTADRDALLADSARDDGIVFYVPAEAGAGTREVFTSTDFDAGQNRPQARYYFVDGPEAEVRTGEETAFSILAEQAPGTTPLMRVFLQNACGTSHDELVPGQARFERVRYQGDQVPVFDLHWSGVKEETTLVVEALGDLCPKLAGGHLSPISKPAFSSAQHDYPPWLSLDEARTESAVGEVYVNGQGPSTNVPRPIARSFLTVSPGPEPDFDWFMGFGDDDSLGTFVDTPCGEPIGSCFQEFRLVSEVMDVSFIYPETPRYQMEKFFNELWVMYADLAGDVNGKFRMTPLTKGRIDADSFLYVTMEVNAFTTGRRYPQIIISDQDPPVQHNLVNGNSVVIQTFGDPPNVYELEVCDHRTWDVNDQCPRYDFDHRRDDSGELTGFNPHPELNEHIGVDRSTTFEVYMSTTQAYLFLDGLPYGCVDLPGSGIPNGDVTVTFGDVLYHSGADILMWAGYMEEHMHTETHRHYDNLGFKSGVQGLPVDWDRTRFPCLTRTVD